MGGFPQGYWYLLMVAGKPGPKKDEEIAAVLQPVINTADKQGLPCYTEVTEEKNLPVLERLGFVVTAQASLFGVQYFVLLRQARNL